MTKLTYDEKTIEPNDTDAVIKKKNQRILELETEYSKVAEPPIPMV